MNLNKKIIISYTLAACMAVSAFSFNTAAATTAGVSSAVDSTGAVSDEAGFSTLAGVSLSVNNILNASLAADVTIIEDNVTEAVAVSEYADIAVANVNDWVYIRTEATSESEKVGKLYANSAVKVHEMVEGEDGTWCYMTSGNCTGYIKAEYLVIGDEELAKSVSRRYVRAHDDLDVMYIRQSPESDGYIIDMISGGEDLTVVDDTTWIEDGWVLASCNEGEGFVDLNLADLGIEYTVAESVEEERARLAKEEEERKKAQAAAAKKAASSKSSQAAAIASASGGSAQGAAVVAYASQFVGNPYVYGGSSLTNGTDCSGFVMSVYAAFGVSLPHSSSADRSVGYAVSLDQIQPGDIVCYSGHVGIYAGNGQLVHASNKRTGITYSNVNYKPILAVRRIF